MFVKELFDYVSRHRTHGRNPPTKFQHAVVAQHGILRCRKSWQYQHNWSNQAKHRAMRREVEITNEIEDAKPHIVLHQRRIEEEVASMVPYRLPACAWKDREFEVFSMLWNSNKYTAEEVARRRDSSILAPCPLSQEGLKQLLSFNVMSSQRIPPPPWVEEVCRRRSVFEGTVFSFVWKKGAQCYLAFLFARMSPFYMLCAEVKRSFQNVRPGIESSCLEEFAKSSWRHRFDIDWHSFVASEHDMIQDMAFNDVSVLQCVYYYGDATIVSGMPWLMLDDVVSRLDPDPPLKPLCGSGQDGGGKTVMHNIDALSREFSWAKSGLEKVFGRSAKVAMETETLPTLHEDEADYYIDDDTMEEMVHDMQKRRLELAEQHESGIDDFKCSLIVRANRAGAFGDIVQGVIANFRNATAEPICIDNSKPKTASLLYSVYTERGANVLARAWAHQMQLFFNLAVRRGTLYQEFSVADRASYQAPTEFEQLAAVTT